MQVMVIGGGAAGFFSAIECKRWFPDTDVVLVEKSNEVLSKVKISGGGRCNVTHACFDPRFLSDYYPRGGKALIGPFHQFHPRDTMTWFERQGVALKIESDNRVFPVSDSSQTIIDCLMGEVVRLGIRLWIGCGVTSILKQPEGQFCVALTDGQLYHPDRVVIATGSSRQGHSLCQALGHTIVAPIPSLFTIKLNDPALTALAGVSVESVLLTLPLENPITQTGPLLITHWGLSGPAMIKLSAWAAREFYDAEYQLPLTVSWLPLLSLESIRNILEEFRLMSKKLCVTLCPFESIPIRLWVYLVQKSLKTTEKRWQELGKKDILRLAECLKSDAYQTMGKGVFKEEFVTCGGVSLTEVNFKTMESKRCSGLFFAGEVLDIDGVTGGFNFQNAWTTGFIVGQSFYA